MHRRPGFSVVTPSFNQAAYIGANIKSVLEQRYPNVEHIIVDNLSTDGTVAILEEVPSLKWVSEADKGQADAVNKGVTLSTNDWILWINSDDFLLDGALEKIADFIDAYPDVSVIISNIIQTDDEGRVTSRTVPRYTPWKLRHWWWSGGAFLWQPGTVIHRRVFEAVGPLDVDLHYAMDFEFFLRAQDHFEFKYLDADLVGFRHHDEQKGHVGEEPFIEERIAVSIEYWRTRGGIISGLYSVLCHFVHGSLLFTEGLRQHERGNRDAGWRLIRKGLLRNPAAVFRPEHLGYWIRRLVGAKRYYVWRAKLR